MTRGKKIALGALIVLAAIVLAAVILVPRLVDVDRYRPEVVDRIRLETGMDPEIGRLSLTVFPAVAIRVDDFALGNPRGFPQGHLVTAKRIDAVVDAGALWNRQIVIRSLQLQDPEIHLLESARGQWNFATPERSKPVQNASLIEAPSFALGIISKVSITGAEISASKLSPDGEPLPAFFYTRGFSCRLADVDLNAFGASLSKSFAPRQLPAMARGISWGPMYVYAASPEDHPAALGTLKADELQFRSMHATSVKSKLRLFSKEVDFDDLNFDLYGGNAGGAVKFDFGSVNPRYVVTAKLHGVDVAKVLQEYPEARDYMTGKMEGAFTVEGEVTRSPDPLAGVRGAGQMSVRNGNLPKLQLNKNLLQLAKVADLGPVKGDPGSFSSIDADFSIAGSRITSRKIHVVGNGVNADASGSLTLAGPGSLDYQGVASLAAGANQLNNIIAGLAGGTIANGRLNLPFAIGGTLNAPKFIAKSFGANQVTNIRSVLGGKAGQATGQPGQVQQPNPANLIQGLAGAFKHKKTK